MSESGGFLSPEEIDRLCPRPIESPWDGYVRQLQNLVANQAARIAKMEQEGAAYRAEIASLKRPSPAFEVWAKEQEAREATNVIPKASDTALVRAIRRS